MELTQRYDELKVADRLPSPQGVALEIIRLTSGDDFSNAQITRAIQADPALAGRLIRAANHAALGVRRPVAAIGDAVLILGVPAVRQLVLGFSLVGNYQRGECHGFDYEGFWSRSLLMAIAAQALCARMRAAAPEEIFACGLLAGIGRLALATAYPEEYGKLLLTMGGSTGAEALAARERDAFAIDHLALTSAMLDDWGIPAIFVNTLRARLDPQRAGFAEGSRSLMLARSLQLAEGVASLALGQPHERRLTLPGVLFDAARMGIDSEELGRIVDDVVKQWQEWARVLDVPAADVGKVIEPPAPPPSEPEPSAHEMLSTSVRLRILEVGARDPAIEELRALVARDGHTVVSAVTAQQALASVVSFKPHLVLAALDLPDDDGARLIRALRNTEMGGEMHIVALAANGDDRRLLGALDAGADDYLVRPLAPRVLLARLRAAQRVLRQQRALSGHIEDIRRFSTELALRNRHLEQAVITDELTGLPNRRYARDRLDQAWAAVQRRGGPLAVIVLDIDRFKRINDTLGHDVGDAVLQHVAALLRNRARLQDVVCRTGGEEFVVISPDTTVEEAHQCAERLRVAVAEAPMDADGRMPKVTISLGIACTGEPIDGPAELLRRADRAMYQAKTSGRNRTCVWGRESAG